MPRAPRTGRERNEPHAARGGELEAAQDPAGDRRVPRRVPSSRRRAGGGRARHLPAVPGAGDGRGALSGLAGASRRSEHAPGAPRSVHGRGVGRDAPRRRRLGDDPRALGASAAVRGDRRSARREGPGRLRRGPGADPLRRRDRGAARADRLRRIGEARQRRRAPRPRGDRRGAGRGRVAGRRRLLRDLRRGSRMTGIPDGAQALPVSSLALVVLDGWGLAPPGPGNAIDLASTPLFDGLWGRYPHTTLSASGRDVGLPDGQMGNSEVGHLNLGAGSIVKQDLARIDEAVADGSFFENPVLKAACEAARQSPRGRLHLMGLVSDGGVHSGWEHIEACVELAAQEGVPDLVVHAFTDGRDTLPRSSRGYLEELERWLRRAGRVGTVSGRYYAMDRDRRWERTKLAYDAIVHAEGAHAPSAVDAVRASHEHGDTDEFVKPTVIGDYDGVADGDAALFFNFRPDRARQLVRALGEPDFDEFPRGVAPTIHIATMTEYQAGWEYPIVFPPSDPSVTLASVLASRGERQLHVAETEKYAHVTYFFNGGRERAWGGEGRRP